SLRGQSLRGRLLTSRCSHYRARSVFRDAHTESDRVSSAKRLLWVFTADYVARGIFTRPLKPYHIWACVWGPPGIHMLVLKLVLQLQPGRHKVWCPPYYAPARPGKIKKVERKPSLAR